MEATTLLDNVMIRFNPVPSGYAFVILQHNGAVTFNSLPF